MTIQELKESLDHVEIQPMYMTTKSGLIASNQIAVLIHDTLTS